MKTRYRVVALAVSIVFVLYGCSITDRGNNYQQSRSNNKQLVTPGINLNSKDKLIIPNEDSIAIYNATLNDFEAPKIPSLLFPLADMELTWDSERMWINASANISVLQPLVATFFTALINEDNSLAINTTEHIETVPVAFIEQGTLAALWSSITRIHPKKVIYDVSFIETNKGTRFGLRYKTSQKNKSGDTVFNDWMPPNTNERTYAVALKLWTELARKITDKSGGLPSESAISENSLWLDDDDNYAIRLTSKSTVNDFLALLNSSEMHLVSEKPLQIAFIKADEIPKIGDLKKIAIPSGSGEELVIGNVRRRNLNDLTWEQRPYNVKLMRRSNGVFLTIDTSEAKFPNVVSYRAMQKLLNLK